MSEYFETPPSRINLEVEHVTPIDTLLIMGTTVVPQFRGMPGKRHMVMEGIYGDDSNIYDSRILRSRTIAAKELAVRGFVDGSIIPSGNVTVKKDQLEKEFYEMQYDMAHAENTLRDKGTIPDETAIFEEMLASYSFLDESQKHALLGRPLNEEEKQNIGETTEAMLIEHLLQQALAKPDVENRNVIPVEIFDENKATNSIENVIYMLNKLDRDRGGMFDGRIGILTSNNGHLERTGMILQILGIDPEKSILLDSEQILRHYGYDERYIKQLEERHERVDTMKMCTRWMEGLRVLPDYVLPELALIENNDRLKFAITSLRQWYQKINMDICLLHPELLAYESREPEKLREVLRNIPRQMPPEEWKDKWDLDQMRQNILNYKKQTEAWLNGEKIG